MFCSFYGCCCDYVVCSSVGSCGWGCSSDWELYYCLLLEYFVNKLGEWNVCLNIIWDCCFFLFVICYNFYYFWLWWYNNKVFWFFFGLYVFWGECLVSCRVWIILVILEFWKLVFKLMIVSWEFFVCVCGIWKFIIGVGYVCSF